MKTKRWLTIFLILVWVVACNPNTTSPLTPTPYPTPPLGDAPSPSVTPLSLGKPLSPTSTRPLLSAEQAAHWQHYPSYNDIQDLAFAPDGTLWAAIFGGIVPVPVAVGTSDEHRSKLFRILSQMLGLDTTASRVS